MQRHAAVVVEQQQPALGSALPQLPAADAATQQQTLGPAGLQQLAGGLAA
jgi:hypothetical protein